MGSIQPLTVSEENTIWLEVWLPGGLPARFLSQLVRISFEHCDWPSTYFPSFLSRCQACVRSGDFHVRARGYLELCEKECLIVDVIHRL